MPLRIGRRRATTDAAATPTRPPGCGGVGPSAALRLLDDALGHRLVGAPRSWPHGPRNAAYANTRTGASVVAGMIGPPFR